MANIQSHKLRVFITLLLSVTTIFFSVSPVFADASVNQSGVAGSDKKLYVSKTVSYQPRQIRRLWKNLGKEELGSLAKLSKSIRSSQLGKAIYHAFSIPQKVYVRETRGFASFGGYIKLESVIYDKFGNPVQLQYSGYISRTSARPS